MDRINHSTATPDRKFTAGNAAASIPATIMTPEFANAVQEELCNVVEAAGLTLDPEDNTQLQQVFGLKAPLSSPAFSGNPTAPTPDQFDNDTTLATTAFVQRALGNYQQGLHISSSQALTAAQAGAVVQVYGTDAVALTLPAVSALPAGAAYKIINESTHPLTLTRVGADMIYDDSCTGKTSIVVARGGSIDIIAMAGGWFASGTGLLGVSPMFAASLGVPGWQLLPSGLILQWGAWLSSGTTGYPVPVTFSIAYPAACRSITACAGYISTTPSEVWFDSMGTTGFNGRAALVGVTCMYMAIGH